jgi:hypothetical protein
VTVRYACAKCRRIIDTWRCNVLADGKLELVAHCHGEQQRKVVSLDMSGVLFHDGSVLELDSRNPDDWLRQGDTKGLATHRRLAGGSGPPRWTKNATLASLGE